MTNVPAFLGLLATAMKAAEAPWPKAVADAIADRAKIAERVIALPSGSHQAVMTAVAAALLDDRDPLDDDQVRRLVTARSITGESTQSLAYGVEKSAETRIFDALAEHADDIIDSLKRAVDTAGQSLTQAYEILGDSDLGDSAAILKLGPAAARAWADADDARQQIRVIDKGWFALGHLTRVVSPDTAPTIRLAAVTLEQYEALGHKADPWSIVRHGATIDYATRTTIPERHQRLADEREAREHTAAAAFTDAARRFHGHGGDVRAVR